MFKKNISIIIPMNDDIKYLTAKYDDKKITSIEGIKNINSLEKLKILNLNCRHVILIPAEKIYLSSHIIKKKENEDIKVAEKSFYEKYNKNNIDLINDYYYDSIHFADPENKNNLNLKLLAVEKEYIDSLTKNLDKYPNNYLVTALPTALYSLNKKFIKQNNYIFYYKIGCSYTITADYKNTLDLLHSQIKEENIEREIKKIRKYYLNKKNTDMAVIEGGPELFNLGKFKNIDKDEFIFLASLLWGVNEW
ncbi:MULTISPECIES: hypothetical protein [unclassified Halanaerobium]|uniref:hypothetical protein n=1 Tax=unclassified Halanaerobium TaxID=2641197 RepID=UPI000DF159D9|nr:MULTISPECIES: hypothetical protein [unclassified Halanaerobium]RCW50528.1 hypothetical protein DFR78_103113 [Halanaerobium sp. MA284_MarDTE_T2]RCW86011.1 hypothetical protein DER71_10976 [Halanaerobium sp. DL-01]